MNELENLILDIDEYNFENEKDESLAKYNLKTLITRNFGSLFLENEEIKNIINNLNKKDFIIDFTFRSKKQVAKYIRKIYRELNY